MEAKEIFPEKPVQTRTTSYGFLALRQNLEKTNDTIFLGKRPHRRKDRRTDRKMDKPYFVRAFRGTTFFVPTVAVLRFKMFLLLGEITELTFSMHL